LTAREREGEREKVGRREREKVGGREREKVGGRERQTDSSRERERASASLRERETHRGRAGKKNVGTHLTAKRLETEVPVLMERMTKREREREREREEERERERESARAKEIQGKREGKGGDALDSEEVGDRGAGVDGEDGLREQPRARHHLPTRREILVLWCFGALCTQIVAPDTPHFYGVISDKLSYSGVGGF